MKKDMNEQFSDPNMPAYNENCPAHIADISDTLLMILATVGSVLGAIGGVLLSKLYLNGFASTGCGSLGCMLGCSILCATGIQYGRPFIKTQTSR
jgi:membrane protein DedA with SNARE-associated domain